MRKRTKVEAPEKVTKSRVERVTAGQTPEVVSESEERKRDELFTHDPCYVRIGSGVTRNLGNYESLRVDVSISVPCKEEDIDAVVADLGDRVADKLEEELDKYFAED